MFSTIYLINTYYLCDFFEVQSVLNSIVALSLKCNTKSLCHMTYAQKDHDYKQSWNYKLLTYDKHLSVAVPPLR